MNTHLLHNEYRVKLYAGFGFRTMQLRVQGKGWMACCMVSVMRREFMKIVQQRLGRLPLMAYTLGCETWIFARAVLTLQPADAEKNCNF